MNLTITMLTPMTRNFFLRVWRTHQVESDREACAILFRYATEFGELEPTTKLTNIMVYLGFTPDDLQGIISGHSYSQPDPYPHAWKDGNPSELHQKVVYLSMVERILKCPPRTSPLEDEVLIGLDIEKLIDRRERHFSVGYCLRDAANWEPALEKLRSLDQSSPESVLQAHDVILRRFSTGGPLAAQAAIESHLPDGILRSLWSLFVATYQHDGWIEALALTYLDRHEIDKQLRAAYRLVIASLLSGSHISQAEFIFQNIDPSFDRSKALRKAG